MAYEINTYGHLQVIIWPIPQLEVMHNILQREFLRLVIDKIELYNMHIIVTYKFPRRQDGTTTSKVDGTQYKKTIRDLYIPPIGVKSIALDKSVAKKVNEITESETLIKKYEEQQKNVRNNREFDSLSKEIEYQNLEIELYNKKIREFKYFLCADFFV